MKLLLVFGLIALIANVPTGFAEDLNESSSNVCADPNSSSDSSNSSPVIVREVTATLVSPYYFSKYKISAKDGLVNVDFIAARDLPSDTIIRVISYGLSDKSSTAVGPEYAFFLRSNDSQYYKYLPSEMTKDLNKEGILTRGHHQHDNYGFFKFYCSLSADELKYKKYTMTFELQTGSETILTLDFKFDSAAN